MSVSERHCRVRSFGPLIVMRWEPRLGRGYCERRRRWPRRWTFAWSWRD